MGLQNRSPRANPEIEAIHGFPCNANMGVTIRRTMALFCWCLLSFALAGKALASGTPSLPGLTSGIAVLTDDSFALSLDDILTPQRQKEFRPVASGNFNFGFRKTAIWIKLSLRGTVVRLRRCVIPGGDRHVGTVFRDENILVQAQFGGDPLEQARHVEALLVHLELEAVDALGETAEAFADGRLLRPEGRELRGQRGARLLGELQLHASLHHGPVDRVEHGRQRVGDVGGELPLRTADHGATRGLCRRGALPLALTHQLIDAGLKLRTMRLPDRFQDHDKPDAQYAEAGLDADHILDTILKTLRWNDAGKLGATA